MFWTSRDLGNPFVNSTSLDEWNLQIQGYWEKVVVNNKDNEFIRLFIHQKQPTQIIGKYGQISIKYFANLANFHKSDKSFWKFCMVVSIIPFKQPLTYEIFWS
jgi:hypothetical protein